MSKRLLFTFVLVLLVGAAAPAGADPMGYIEADLGVGYFYGTFNQDPNVVLLVGGAAEEFCIDNPEDPFSGEPGVAPHRLFPRDDGSLDIKANDKDQPIYLYHSGTALATAWIDQVCDDYFADGSTPEAFAEGTADLKVRVSVLSENLVDVFNSVNGKATGADGSEYKVRAWADLIVENGVPQGNPEDFVGFKMTEIRR